MQTKRKLQETGGGATEVPRPEVTPSTPLPPPRSREIVQSGRKFEKRDRGL